MTDRIVAAEFRAEPSLAGWRADDDGAVVTFATGTFARGLELVNAIGELAEAADHHPDVDLRFPTVTVRVTSHDVGGLSRRDLVLAQRVTQAAQRLGVRVEEAG